MNLNELREHALHDGYKVDMVSILPNDQCCYPWDYADIILSNKEFKKYEIKEDIFLYSPDEYYGIFLNENNDEIKELLDNEIQFSESFHSNYVYTYQNILVCVFHSYQDLSIGLAELEEALDEIQKK